MTPSDANPRLRVKSYFAASIPEAMEQARVELGPDALFLNSREAPPEARHMGACEVVFGVRSTSAAPLDAPGETGASPDELRRFMGEIREFVTRVRSDQERQMGRGLIEQALVDAGLTRALAQEIEQAVQQRWTGKAVFKMGQKKSLFGQDEAEVVAQTLQEIESRISIGPELGRVSAFIGPPGGGKTSCLVKLAISRGLLEQRPIRLVSVDQYRIGAADQLRTYAGILGVPFILAETPAALLDAIQTAPPQALVLIDTPGVTRANLDVTEDLAAVLRDRQEIDTQLVLTAGSRPGDLARSGDLFRRFRPSRLLFTRLDETDSTASIVCEAVRSGLPLSFFGTGQVIPEDLESAAKARVTAPLVHELPLALAAAA